MDRGVALASRQPQLWRRLLERVRWLTSRPQQANAVLLATWCVTRLILLLGLVLGHHYCDAAFYNYAGDFAVGRLPYRDVLVEYPPLAMVLLLLPALPLLAFPALAPRPDAAFAGPLTRIPIPDPVRYSAYGLSFAVEMLIIDALTLWLVRAAARKFMPGDRYGLRAGLVYVLLVFASGALLQKFELAGGALVLAAGLALVSARTRTAWAVLGLAVLVKGYPLLLVPIFAAYLALRAHERGRRPLLARWIRACLAGTVWCGLVLLIVTVPVLLGAGWRPVVDSVRYHAVRGLEIESLYANALMLIGWVPSLAARTAFDTASLSRVVVSPGTPVLMVASLGVVAAFIALAYGATAWGMLRIVRDTAHARAPTGAAALLRTRARLDPRALAQLLAISSVAVLLGFMLGFRALPSHYVLMVMPLAAVIALARGRHTVVWVIALGAVGALGQAVAMMPIWQALVALDVGGVALLTVRNGAWLATFGILVVALWRGEWAMPPAGTAVDGTDRTAPAHAATTPLPTPSRERWARELVARWRTVMSNAPAIPGFRPRGEDVFAHLVALIEPAYLLLGAGAGSAAIYLGFVLAFPLLRLWNQPHVADSVSIINDMGRITGYNPLAAAAFVLAVLALFTLQFLALVAATHLGTFPAEHGRWRVWARRGVLLFPALFILVMIWMQPVTTTDLYGYVARGYLYAILHHNPMTTPAFRLPGGLVVDRPAAPYGPAWLLLAGLIARVSGENLLGSMLAFKAVEAAATIAAIVLVDRLALALYPARRLRTVVLFAWSPLLIFEAIGNGHNDIVMMLCVLLAFAMMLRGRSRTAFALLVLGALVKYVAAVFVPLWLIYELRRRAHLSPQATALPERTAADAAGAGFATRMGGLVATEARTMARQLAKVNRREAVSLLASVALIGAAMSVASYAPFWQGLTTFTGLGQQLRPLYYNSSIVAFITAPLQLIVPTSEYAALDKTVRLVCYLIFGTYCLLQMYHQWRAPVLDPRDVVTAAAKITFAALVIITFWYQPWYVVWLLPLAALSRHPYVRRAGTILALGSLMTYAISNFLLVGETGIARDMFVQFFQIMVTFGPLLFLRAAPYDEGWLGIARRYLGSLGAGVSGHPVYVERAMLALTLVVAALLRLLRLGNLFAPILGSTSTGDTLKAISGNLRLVLSDPQGLNAPFIALYHLLVHIFGPTPLATLLPSAIFGTLTVWVIYLLASEIMRHGGYRGARGIALLAALLAATSRWHVSLSRSGVEVVLLPLLMCTALYVLLVAFRLGAGATAAAPEPLMVEPGPAVREALTGIVPRRYGARRRVLGLYAVCGVCTGLACDLAPGLWLMPILVVGFVLAWRVRRSQWFAGVRAEFAVLAGSAIVTGVPAIGYFLSARVGFPAGSAVMARAAPTPPAAPSMLSGPYWAQVFSNAVAVLRLLVAQDYSAGYPAVGGTTLIPVLLSPFFFLGILMMVLRWRNMASLALMLLIALPLVASVAVGAPTSVIEAASVLPATCIVPALGLYEFGTFLGHLPIVLDRVHGARVFSTPEQIGQVLLLAFLIVSTIRTFFWYFEATLPTTPPNQYTPTYVGAHVAVVPGTMRDALALPRAGTAPYTYTPAQPAASAGPGA